MEINIHKEITIYRITYWDNGGREYVEGYYTMEAFEKYLDWENKYRIAENLEPEKKEDFSFEEINIHL